MYFSWKLAYMNTFLSSLTWRAVRTILVRSCKCLVTWVYLVSHVMSNTFWIYWLCASWWLAVCFLLFSTHPPLWLCGVWVSLAFAGLPGVPLPVNLPGYCFAIQVLPRQLQWEDKACGAHVLFAVGAGKVGLLNVAAAQQLY